MSDALRNALAELEYLKALKDWMNQPGSACEEFRGRKFLTGEAMYEYRRRQPLAWEAARAALAALPEQRPQAPELTDEQIGALVREHGIYGTSISGIFAFARAIERAVKQGAPAAPADLRAALEGARMKYGTVGSRDVDVADWNARIDRALAALASPAAPRNDLSDPAQATNKGKAP